MEEGCWHELLGAEEGRSGFLVQVASGFKKDGHLGGVGGQDTLAMQLPTDSTPPALISFFWFLWLAG